jgi:hypothetical protein
MQAWMRKINATNLWRSNNRPLEMEAGHERSREPVENTCPVVLPGA